MTIFTRNRSFKNIRIILTTSGLITSFALTADARPAPLQGKQWVNPVSILYFVENKGQVTDQFQQPRPDIDFHLNAGNGLNVFIGSGAIHYQWFQPASEAAKHSALNTQLPTVSPQSWNGYRLDVMLVGANPNATVITEGQQDYYEYYYTPTVTARNSTKNDEGIIALSYQKIIYQNVYPNIDWVLYLKTDRVEYDFVIRPGGKSSDIRLRYNGASSMNLNTDGSLTVTTPMGSITEQAPRSFQEDGREVVSRFALKENELCFETAAYRGELTIDPTVLWATYYGASGLDAAYNTVCDDQGNVYATGPTQGGTNIATAGSYQSTFVGYVDGFLVKFNGAGKRIWATYYGGGKGSDQTFFHGITYDHYGGIYVCGTTSNDQGMTTPGSYQPGYGGSTRDALLVKFDTAGIRQWATYYGGERADIGDALVCDHAGYIYMKGSTESTTGIATPKSHQDDLEANYDAFLVKFDSAGNRQWATYYGGYGFEYPDGSSIACDGNNCIYIAGATNSTYNIATPNGFQPVHSSPASGNTSTQQDIYLAKFDSSGSLQWGTYYGGTDYDFMSAIYNSLSTDDSDNVYLGFYTQSTAGIASPGSYQSSFGGGPGDIALVKFDSAGNRQWATYYGGTGPDGVEGILCLNNDIYLSGGAGSATGIITPGQTPNTTGQTVPYLAKFNKGGYLQWATYYGGHGSSCSITQDGHGNLYMGGLIMSAGLPATATGFQDTFGGGDGDGFLLKICAYAVTPDIFGTDTACAHTTQTYLIRGGDYDTCIWELPSGWTKVSSTDSTITVTTDTSILNVIQAKVVYCEDTSDAQVMNVYVYPPDSPFITVDSFVLSTLGHYSSYQWYRNNMLIPGATDSNYTVAENGSYMVVVTNTYGCSDTSRIYKITNYNDNAIENIQALARSVKIYPNPARNKIYVSSLQPVNIRICSLAGSVLMQQNKVKTMDISRLSAGIYLLQVTDENGVLLKVIKLAKME